LPTADCPSAIRYSLFGTPAAIDGDREIREEGGMVDHIVPHFQNDAGVPAIDIGVREFMCIGAAPPDDHPHVFLDMGDEDEKVCPYCSTLFRYRRALAPTETNPPGHLYRDDRAAA
jgi:uncharacterized Zn-finger protein